MMILPARKQVCTDEERMQKDRWDLRTFSDWNKPENFGTEGCGKIAPILDFRVIKNREVREEVKDYTRYQIVSGRKKLKTIFSQRHQDRTVWLFLNTLSLKETLLEIPLEEAVEKFRLYLQTHTDWDTICIIERVGIDQKIKCYVEDSNCLNSIKQLHKFLQEKQQDKVPEREKDVWDIRRLPFPVDVHKSRERYLLNFTRIPQEDMREVMKKYVYERLKVRKLSCVHDDFKALNLFTGFLAKYYPEITKFSQLTRQVVEEYMVYLNKQDMALTTKRSRIGFLRTFFKIVRFLELCDMPQETLIPYGNLYKKVRPEYKIIPDCAMDDLNAHIDELPREIRMMVLLLEYVGMRINECCQLRVDCLRYDSTGEAFLEYFQSKTSHVNRVPISKFLEGEIVKQQEWIRRKFPNAQYLLTTDGRRPVGQEGFSFHVNRLAYQYHITDEVGELFRFKSHQFRHTLATKYALGGMSPNMIRAMLGHQDLRSIQFYIDMRDTIRNEQLQTFLKREEEQYKLLRQQGGKKQVQAIPLAYGYCNQQDLCETVVACYSCGMFHMGTGDKKNVSSYLQLLRKKIEEAKRMGLERQLELYKQMVKVISEGLE